MIPGELRFNRMILFRPRPEFLVPPEWLDRAWIPLGELRPLLQALSPVRDLADLWRWVAAPLPDAAVKAALTPFGDLEVRWAGTSHAGAREVARQPGQCGPGLVADLIPAASQCEVERIELTARELGLLATLTAEAADRMLSVAAALRQECGCLTVGV